jgi:hypothetical protein
MPLFERAFKSLDRSILTKQFPDFGHLYIREQDENENLKRSSLNMVFGDVGINFPLGRYTFVVRLTESEIRVTDALLAMKYETLGTKRVDEVEIIDKFKKLLHRGRNATFADLIASFNLALKELYRTPTARRRPIPFMWTDGIKEEERKKAVEITQKGIVFMSDVIRKIDQNNFWDAGGAIHYKIPLGIPQS